jgi:4-amino-4-deoxy-L-arabinose transferase-like glycosyltransferase
MSFSLATPARAVQSTLTRSATGRSRLWLIAGLIVALVWRIILYAPGYTPDSERFLMQAAFLLRGAGFVYEGQPTAALPPGYPVFLVPFVALTSPLVAIRFIQVVLSVVSCYLVYLALRPVDRRIALVGLWAMAVHPYLARIPGTVLSETLSVFLASLAVWLIQRSRSGPSAWIASALGLVLTALSLTAPGVIALVICVFAAMCWQLRQQPRAVVGFGLGSLLLIVPWQVHCVKVTSHLQPLILDMSKHGASTGGFVDWHRTWVRRERDLNVLWKRSLDGAPDYAFSSREQRIQLANVSRLHNERLLSDTDYESSYRRAADVNRNDRPGWHYVGLPALRAFYLWTDMPSLGHLDSAYINRLSPARFRESLSDRGVAVALMRGAKAAASLLVYLLFLLYPLAFGGLTVAAMRSRQPLAIAIAIGTVAYTFASTVLVFGEVRRNLVLFPFLLFLLFLMARKTSPAVNRAIPFRLRDALSRW